MSFSKLGLSAPILKAIEKQGYKTPSPIQEQAIPIVLAGKDLMAAAQTGTGKTAGFTLPILEILSKGPKVKPGQTRALIITPTRELAAQVEASVTTYGKNLHLFSTVVFGGVKINPQINRLKKGVDILVATPGRLIDLYNQKAVRFDQLEILVLDEADRMLDMGFIHDIRKIKSFLPAARQNLMFSATFSKEIRTLAKSMINNPVEISVSPRNTTVKSVKQWICPVDKKQKSALLAHLIHENKWDQVLVFSRTKHGANRLVRQLEDKQITAIAIHGNKSQGARTRALADFKKGAVRVMVATDIAARGIDINQLPQVINFDLPNVPEDYVHRIGRTGRAGKKGQAVSLVSADEFVQLWDIEKLLKQQLARKLIDGFEPNHDVPVSDLSKRPKKPKQTNTQGRRGNNQKPKSRRKKPSNKNQRKSSGNNSGGGNRTPRKR
ncbi:MAG TPA: DEAD/DEAH box helicase [Leucothrix sp.]|nr:DEAD/DEAH box helicase [Leucothrix sp.]